jgi:FO synthase
MARLRPVNVSLGLMLEATAERLCAPGGPHARAPDKRPERRIAMTRAAGALRIPFTSGLLVGIGETRRERIAALLALRALHAEHGHLQELIIQPFRPHADTRMASAPPPPADEVALTIAMARLLMPPRVSVQAPPNLMPLAATVAAGVNDLGGISPVTPDFINPGHPWPHLERLGAALADLGRDLQPRLPIYDAWLARPGFLDDALRGPVAAANERLGRGLPTAEVAA